MTGKNEQFDMQGYTPTIGLEIHAELKTNTKMFCGCKNDPDEKRPNHNVCPVCMGHPGTLPTINKQAVKNLLKMGIAVGGTVADFTEFDRKNYFYPDIPKGYQLSQYAYPFVKGGSINGIALTRIHLEEDTARSSHEGDSQASQQGSRIDFNRSSVPLMELVTEPVIHSAEQAGNFARELQLLLTYLDIAEANMEKGEMRVEANISVSKTSTFGTKVEVKNLNSFKAAEKAIEYEIKRHIEILEAGGTIVQETRGYDEKTGETFSQRKKENSHDYRYFPEPDLPKMTISNIPEFSLDVLRKEIPELPDQQRTRYVDLYQCKNQEVEFYISNHGTWDAYFEEIVRILENSAAKEYIKTASNFITSDLAGIQKNSNIDFVKIKSTLTPQRLSDIVTMYAKGELSSRGAKDIIALVLEHNDDPQTLAQKFDLIQKNDLATIEKIVDEIIAAHPQVIEDYKAGKAASLQFLVGQGMKVSKGSANPGMLKDIIIKKIV